MKIGGDKFRSMISTVVREEVRRALPSLVAEVLAERYLRRVMTEVVSAAAPASRKGVAPVRARNLRELMQGDEENWEEGVPRALENDHEGIYHQSPLVRGKGGQKNEGRRLDLTAVYGEDPEVALRDPRLERHTQEPIREAHANEDAVRRMTAANPELAVMFEGTRPSMSETDAGATAMGQTQQRFGEEGVPLDFLGKIGVNFGSVKRNVEGNAPPATRETVDEGMLRQLELRRKALERKVI